MTQDILITPGSGEPQILFRGSGTNDTPIELNVLSSYQSATGSGTALVYEGQEGQLFAVTDNLSSGTIFSVGDITGLSMLSVDASGDVKLGEFANSVIVYPGLTLDDNVPSTTSNVLYNDGGDLMWNGVTVIQSGAAQAVDGSGTASYVARFTDTNTLGTGIIYDNGTNVGIGTASPSQKLTIADDNAPFLRFDRTGAGRYDFEIGMDSSADLIFRGGGDATGAGLTEYMRIKSGHSSLGYYNGGDVGIGTASPSQKLDIRYPASGGMVLLKSTDTNDGLLFGDMAYSTNNTYQGMKHAAMTGDQDYMILSEGTNTYISAKSGGITVIGAGGNDTNSQIRLTSTEVVVNENSSSRDFRVESNNDANALFVDGIADRVGIGTGSPAAKLDVNTGTNRALIGSPSFTWGGNSSSTFPTLYSSNSSAWVMHVNPHISYVQNGVDGYTGNTNGATVRFASDTSATTFWDIGIGTNAVGTDKLSIGRGGSTNFLAIDNTGNVGIGTASPNRALHLYSSATTDFGLQVESTAGNSSVRIIANTTTKVPSVDFYGTSTRFGRIGIDRTSNIITGLSKNDMFVTTSESSNKLHLATNSISRVTVDTDGNVGIGTTSPSEKLHVAGDVLIDGDGGTIAGTTWDNGLLKIGSSSGGISIDTNEIYASHDLYLGSLNSASAIILRHSNTERMRVASNGYVGIGTSSPQDKLHVNGGRIRIENVTDPKLSFNDGSANRASMFYDTSEETFVLNHTDADANQLVLTSGNDVGIGTNAPNATLHVYSAVSGDSIFNVEGTNGSLFGVTDNLSGVLMSVNTIAGLPVLEVNSDYSLTAGRFNQNDFVISSGGDIGIGTNNLNRGKVQIEEGITYASPYNYRDDNHLTLENSTSLEPVVQTFIGNLNGSNRYGNLLFYPASTQSASKFVFNADIRQANHFSILGDGKVGIGTVSPSQKLHVAGNLRLTGAFYDSNNAAGTNGQVLSSTATGTDWISLSEIQGVDGTGSAGQVAFWSDADTITGESNLYWDSANNRLGINTSSPSSPYSLHVNGYALIQAGTQPTLKIDAINTSSPSYTANIELNGYGGRGQGIFFKDKDYANEEWFMGMPYQGYFDKFQIGYDSSGGQGEYLANAFVTVNYDGNVGIGTSSPTEKLEVEDHSTNPVYAKITNSYSTGKAGIKLTTTYGATEYSSYIWDDWVGVGTVFQASRDLNTGQGGFNWLAANGSSMMSLRRNGGTVYGLGVGGVNALVPLHVKDRASGSDGIRIDYGSDSSYNLRLDGVGGIRQWRGTGSNGGMTLTTSLTSGSWGGDQGGLIAFKPRDTEAARFDGLGNFGIGTTSPSTKLHIYSAAQNPGMILESDSTSGAWIKTKSNQTGAEEFKFGTNSVGWHVYNDTDAAYRLSIANDGNVGIGTTSPAAKLDVNGSVRIDSVSAVPAGCKLLVGDVLQASSAAPIQLGGLVRLKGGVIIHDNTSVSTSFYLEYAAANGLSIYRNAGTGSQNILLAEQGGNVGIGTASPNEQLSIGYADASSAKIEFRSASYARQAMIEGIDGQSSGDGHLAFHTRKIGNALERLRITADGNVGIGTASPSAKLDVKGTWVSNQGLLSLDADNGTRYAGLTMQNNGTAYGYLYHDNTDSYVELRAATSNGIRFTTNNDFRMFITSAGDVGIGTASPAEKLHVSDLTDFIVNVDDTATRIGTQGNYDLAFVTNRSTATDSTRFIIKAANAGEALRIDANNNVGVGTDSPNAVLHAYGSTPSGTVFNVEGTNGSLFSVVDNLSGVLMSVNNNAGLPVFEVNDDDSIVGGRFAQNDFVVTTSGDIGMGTANPSSKLEVNGTVTATCASLGQLNVDNLRLDGNTLSSTNTNGALILNPNGTGALQTDSGGNARGAYAVDLQRKRGSATQVASGACSTISGGEWNTASQSFSTVGGGVSNCATGSRSTVSGGVCNSATACYSTVSGGYSNTATGTCSTVGGGRGNTASGYYSTIAGGWNNTASCNSSTVSGGYGHCADGNNAAIGGGYSNTVTGACSTVSGGAENTASGSYSTVGGGGGLFGGNTASGSCSTVSGGRCNCAAGRSSTVSGGYSNTASGYYSTVGGGRTNTSTANYSTVAGGSSNNANGCNSFVGGGYSNYAGNFSTVSGGYDNTANTSYATISGGVTNSACACYSTVVGGYQAKASRHGEVAHAAGQFAQNGDAQHSTFVARKNTTDATANVELFLDNSAQRMILTAETTWTFDIKLSAYNDTDNTTAWWIIRGGIRRNAANGTTLIGSLIEERDYEGTMSGTSAAVTADDTNESLKIAVTGLASKNIRWVAVVDVAQVSWGTP
jgi:hypothetical protein